ncbi:MAG: sigma 54-interacting transcriptional regulator [Kofleriaceae bacterium]
MADFGGPQSTTRLIRPEAEGTVTALVVWGAVARVFPLPANRELRIGRASDVEIVLDEPSLSRRHAVIRNRDGVIEVEDLGSANGTIVAGRTLHAGDSVEVEIGDSIQLGTVLVVMQHRSGELAEQLRPQASAVPLDALVDRIAASDMSVLILGETGVGKERMAERLHTAGPRRDRPLVRINCAALSGSLLETELFGHEKGAFTGAVKDKPGLVESADGGTLFLDEIGEIEPAVQVKLLRVLEARETQRVGALRPRSVDVRFVAATNRKPGDEIRAGRMRADLYYRIAAFTLTIPPLRDRPDELEALAVQLLASACERTGARTLTERALAQLARHRWPGNVRELRNVLERAVVLSESSAISEHDIALAIQHGAEIAIPGDAESSDRERVLEVLAACDGNQTEAAERLGISRRTLVYRLQAWGMTRKRRSR